nr:MAG TPA: hypothetical protein [Caudoviricetes sp.]
MTSPPLSPPFADFIVLLKLICLLVANISGKKICYLFRNG